MICAQCAHIGHHIHAWMLASAVHTANRVKYMSTLCTYQVLPLFDGPTADGLDHALCWGRSHCATCMHVHTYSAQVCSRLYENLLIVPHNLAASKFFYNNKLLVVFVSCYILLWAFLFNFEILYVKTYVHRWQRVLFIRF